MASLQVSDGEDSDKDLELVRDSGGPVVQISGPCIH